MAEIFVRYIMIKKDVNKEEFQLIDKVKQFFKENYDIDQLEGIINIEKGELSYYIKPNSDATRCFVSFVAKGHIRIISKAIEDVNYKLKSSKFQKYFYILKAYDMEGNHLLTFGEKGKDGDDWLAYVSQIMEIPEGFFGIDANMRDLYIWGPDASVLGSVEAPDLFGARYAWIAGAAKQDDGSILVALTQDRDDDSATELLLYRLSGF